MDKECAEKLAAGHCTLEEYTHYLELSDDCPSDQFRLALNVAYDLSALSKLKGGLRITAGLCASAMNQYVVRTGELYESDCDSVGRFDAIKSGCDIDRLDADIKATKAE